MADYDRDVVEVMDVIKAASGTDENGFARSAIALYCEKIDVDGNVLENLETVSCKKPIINIFRNYKYIFVDLKFATHLDVDLDMINSLMANAFKPSDNEQDEFTMVTLSIVPEEYEGRYYIVATDPCFFALTSDNPRNNPNTMRLVFDENDFYIMEASDQDLIEAQMEAAAINDEEERKQDYYDGREERKRYH